MSSFYLIVKRGETSLRLGYSAQQVHIIIIIIYETLKRKKEIREKVTKKKGNRLRKKDRKEYKLTKYEDNDNKYYRQTD